MKQTTHRIPLLAATFLDTLTAGLVGNAARAQPATLSSSELHRRTLERRAVEAAIWGIPLVNFDAMRQAFFRGAQATYGDLMFWSRPGSWKLQGLTPNTVTFRDGTGQRLRGGDTYRLRVPADVPVQQFWSVTAYDHGTAALIRQVARASLDSYDTKARKHADGSVDVYLGPKAPEGTGVELDSHRGR
jgi:hypothetical protein